MITRMQSKTLRRTVPVSTEAKLSALEKSMLRWVVVDPDDRLLDANIGNGMMAEYLRRNMQCEVCGVSDRMEEVRYARSLLRSCDIVYAPAGDIPWREDAFDTVLMKLDREEDELLERLFEEAKRVLKPGGQLILGASSYPAVMSAVAGLFSDGSAEDRRFFRKDFAEQLLQDLSYQNITWQRTSFSTGVMVAWKPKPQVDQVRKGI